ncbi:MAG: hypothetical protein K6F27_05295 [Ruminococcus sp.]|nr:hypothetical protein [Ruminococcus sp.]
MLKKAAALILSAALALAAFTGCGNKIQGHEAKIITQSDTSEQQVTNKEIKPLYDPDIEKAKDIDYLNADNMQFYFDRLVVAGDSIANGWQYYNILPKSRSIAYGGLSTFGFSVWEFDTTGTSMSMQDTLKKVNPTLLYICLGMNDVNQISADEYAKQYKELLQNIKKIVPDCLVVVQSITPVASTNEYPKVTNDAIKKYNAKLQQMLPTLGREDIIYFNAYNSLLDSKGMMDAKYDAGDGLHINTDAYKKLLADLSKRLNAEMAKQRLEAYDEQRKENGNTQ